MPPNIDSAPASGIDGDQRPGLQKELAGRDDALALFKPLRDHRRRRVLPGDFHEPDRRAVIIANNIHEEALVPMLDSVGRDDNDIVHHAELQSRGDRKARPERIVGVLEFRFQTDRPGCKVDLIVADRQLAGCDLARLSC